MNAPLATLPEIRDYFGLTSKEMSVEWKDLTSQDKIDLKFGIGDSSLTY